MSDKIRKVLEELVIGKQQPGSIGTIVSREEKQQIDTALSAIREELRRNVYAMPCRISDLVRKFEVHKLIDETTE